MGPYEYVWIGAAVFFFLLGPPLMAATLAWVRRKRAKGERGEGRP
ncbi:MAG: hypothetical protein AB7N76_16185 [Planctomycetota bacterium]